MDPEEEELERSVLLDLQRFEQQGVRLTRAWTTADRLEDMTLELRRIVLAMDERSNVNMMRDGLRMLVTGIEMVSNRFHILDLEGWSSDVCQDLNALRHEPRAHLPQVLAALDLQLAGGRDRLRAPRQPSRMHP